MRLKPAQVILPWDEWIAKKSQRERRYFGRHEWSVSVEGSTSDEMVLYDHNADIFIVWFHLHGLYTQLHVLQFCGKVMSTDFWVLVSSLQDYYSPAMLGLKTDQEVLGELVKMKVPAVAELMERHGVMWTLVVSRWFICLFIDILPVEVTGNKVLLIYTHYHHCIFAALAVKIYWTSRSCNLNSLLSCRLCSEYGIVYSMKGQRSSSVWP